MQKDIKVVGVHKLNDMGIYLEFNEENVMEAVAMIIAPKDSVYKNGILFFKINFPMIILFHHLKFIIYQEVLRVSILIYIQGQVKIII